MSSNLPLSFKPRSNEITKKTTPASFKEKGNLPKSFTPINKKVKEDSMWKDLARTAYQVPSGILQRITYPMDLVQMMGIGEALDPEEIEQLKAISEREGIPFDEEKYRKAAQQAAETFPTQSNIERKIEEKTGAPLTPKSYLQKGLRFASSAGAFTPGTLSQKVAGAGIATAGKEGLQAAGVPEPVAEFVSLPLGVGLGSKTPAISASVGKARKPSGLTERRFENVKEPKSVSPKTIDKINQKVETEFRDLSKNIIKDSPVGETAQQLINNPKYKQESRALLDEAQEIANKIPGELPTQSLKEELADLANKKVKGYSLSEYDKEYIKYINEEMQGIKADKMTHGQMVEQYRKNNESLREYFEPGSSKAKNRAKRDSILEHNRAIAKVMEKTDPELSKVFKEGNERWTKIMDIEAIDDFVSDIFSGDKINYRKAREFFDKSGQDRIFKRALGSEGFKQFETLMEDLLTSEVPYGMLRAARQKGFQELFETAGAYLLNPKLGHAKLAWDTGKKTYKSLMNALLDKPKLVFEFNTALKDLKSGKFEQAQKEFTGLKGTILEAEKAPVQKKQDETIDITPKQLQEKSKKRLESPPKRLEKPPEPKKPEPPKSYTEETPATKNTEYKPKEVPRPEKTKVELPETRGSGEQFHGSPKEIKDVDHSHYSSLNYYGQGFYTTDALDIASGYASRKGKSTSPTIYRVTEKKPVKFFDMEKPIPQKIKNEMKNLKYADAIGENLSENPNQTLRELYDDMRESGYLADEIQEEMDIIARMFEKSGYGGFRHEGGKITGKKPHDVKIYFMPEEQVSIEKISDPSKYKKK